MGDGRLIGRRLRQEWGLERQHLELDVQVDRCTITEVVVPRWAACRPPAGATLDAPVHTIGALSQVRSKRDVELGDPQLRTTLVPPVVLASSGEITSLVTATCVSAPSSRLELNSQENCRTLIGIAKSCRIIRSSHQESRVPRFPCSRGSTGPSEEKHQSVAPHHQYRRCRE